jgi:hypothetical protein
MYALVDAEKNSVKNTNQDYIKMLEKLLQFIADNKTSVQVLLGINGNPAFQKNFLRHVIKRTQELMPKNLGKSIDAEKQDYYSNFAVGGFLAILQTWINNNMNLSVGELAKLILQLFGTSAHKELER